MSATTVTLRRPAPAVNTPAWAILLVLTVGFALYAAVSAEGRWPLTVAVLFVVATIFVLVPQHPYVGICLFLTTFLINYPGVARGAGAVTINNALGMIFVGLLAWDYYLRQDAWYLRDPLVRVLLLIGAIFIVGTMAAEYTLPDEHVQRMITKRFGAVYSKTDYTSRFLFQFFSRLAFMVFIVQFIRTPRQLLWVFLTLLGCILVAVPPALSGYLQASGEEVRALARVVNWADNANRFAFGCLIGIAFLYHLGMTAGSRLKKLLAAGGVVLLLPLVLLSASRSGFMGMFILGALMAAGTFGRRGERPARGPSSILPVLGLASVALVTYFFLLTPALQERVLNIIPFAETSAEGSTSTEFREATLRDSVAIIQKHPILGVGIGNFRWVHKLFYGRFKPPHNSYVWALAEGGVPLFAAYLWFFVILWRRLGRLREPYRYHPELTLFPHWLRVYFVLLLFFSFFADVWIEEHLFLLASATMLLERWRDAPAAAGAADRLASV